jgi:hypothetical protein
MPAYHGKVHYYFSFEKSVEQKSPQGRIKY